MKPRLLSVVMIVVALVVSLPIGCTRQETKETRGNTTSSGRVYSLAESSFDAEIQNGVVLVEFWAPWCGPCKMQDPIVEQVAERVEGKAKVAKLDIDTAPKIAQQLGISAIPALIVFKNGKPETRFVGVTEAEKLVSAITSASQSK